ncbi:peptidase M23, partial [Streptomyces sp. NPDC057654]
MNALLSNKMAHNMTAYRASCARVIVQAVKDRGLNQRAAAIALATTIVESSISNIDGGDADSVGLYQQRASWGSFAQRTNAPWATNKFLDVMQNFYPNGSWNSAPIGDVAADVQRPASQYRYRYGVEANDAVLMAKALWDSQTFSGDRMVTASNTDGRMEVYAGGDDGVWHTYQTSQNGGWAAWEFWGGPKSANLASARS